MPPLNTLSAALVTCALLATRLPASAEHVGDKPPYNPYAKLLADAHIEATQKGVTEYLQSLVPSQAERAKRDAQVAGLIAQLGDANFAQREEAMHRLVSLPDLSHEKLRAAAASDDPEIRWRSELVLKLASRPNPLPEAVCRTIQILKIKGTYRRPESTTRKRS